MLIVIVIVIVLIERFHLLRLPSLLLAVFEVLIGTRFGNNGTNKVNNHGTNSNDIEVNAQGEEYPVFLLGFIAVLDVGGTAWEGDLCCFCRWLY